MCFTSQQKDVARLHMLYLKREVANEVSAMSLKQVKSKKVSELIRDQLEDMIRSGDIQPGEKLDSVEKLSATFQVSRSAVREALSALRAVGLVTIRQGEGTFVNKFDFSSMVKPVGIKGVLSNKEKQDLFQVRKILEVGVASLAAENRSADHLAKIEEALSQMAKAEAGKDLGEEAEATENDLLMEMMQKLSDTLVMTMYESRKISLYAEKQTLKQLHYEHEQIYKAVEAQDKDKAHEAMMVHLVNVEQALMEYDKQKQEDGSQ
ncbi:FadR/GntR family transcriptional regulator [Shouchella clausii]|uniref:FadR/GntR family transcriptional regulator n=1 Tax=Shouchella clausii TaxID=79880 RepID=UPI002DBDBF99|nr:FadR/GntR family transcriptional regulator [Shouchella clausii]MEB5479190.1 FadR/GntR family transcriptional regulator [Shouchella clausii]